VAHTGVFGKMQLRASLKSTECKGRITVRASVAPADGTSEFKQLLTSVCPTERNVELHITFVM
jgi:hypothetical protein